MWICSPPHLVDDIRNWATQPDPCLSLLDEWFATHKTREGTYAVMKMLIEINRTDAAEIVEKALADVGECSIRIKQMIYNVLVIKKPPNN